MATFHLSGYALCKALLELTDALINKRLGVRQLRYLPKVNENSGMLYYQLVDKISIEQRVPKSTVRWNLEKLRDSGMIIAGSKEAKGIPVRLTEKGMISLLIMERKYEFLGKISCSKSLFETGQHLQLHGAVDGKAKGNSEKQRRKD